MSELLNEGFLARLNQLAQDKAQEYRTNKPFPSIYFDDFLPRSTLEAALRDFPEPQQLRWSEYSDQNQVSWRSKKRKHCPIPCARFCTFSTAGRCWNSLKT